MADDGGRDAQTRQARVAAARWYHDFDFGDGVRATSHHENPEGVRAVWAFIARQLGGVPFAGASVLDVGAWDGYWSFFAERHGAREVLAVDDASQRWADDSGIALARELLGSRIAIREDVPIYEVAALGRRFDVVLCLGVFYHLWDPLYGFAQLRHCCHRDTLVIVEGEVAWGGLPANGVRYAVSSWQECVPSASALETLLRLAYFRVDERVWMHSLPAAAPADGELRIDRALLVCRPFAGRNPAHQYRPHFGLAGYDDRFRSDARRGAGTDRGRRRVRRPPGRRQHRPRILARPASSTRHRRRADRRRRLDLAPAAGARRAAVRRSADRPRRRRERRRHPLP